MKPTKCWNCLYLGKCMEYNKFGCEKFVKWKLTYKEVADLCKISERTLYRWLYKPKEALANIYRLTGLKFKIYWDGSKSSLVRVIDKEQDNEM